MTRTLPLLLALAWSVTSLAAAPNWTREAAWREARAVDAPARVEQLLWQTSVLSSKALHGAVTAIELDPSLSPPQREWILASYARALREQALSPQALPVLASLREHVPGVLVPHEESASYGVPLFNVAAEAAGTLNSWAANRQREAANAALDRGDAGYFERVADGSLQPPQLLGLRQAIADAPRDAVMAVGKGLQTLLERQPGAVWVALEAWRVTGDTRYIEAALAADNGVLAGALARADELLSPQAALPVWRAALAHPDRAVRAAVLAPLARAGEIAPVIALLGDDELGSAAALALAKVGAVDALEHELATGGRIGSAHAALGLKLAGSPAAIAILERYATTDTELAQEVAKWLR